ncbi:MAG TPA: hypothetical protein VNZ27_13465 [Rhodanobacter sp.]|jgi:hypothetical protein|nr:hypothetical protein [Rhodanobacter sp.]
MSDLPKPSSTEEKVVCQPLVDSDVLNVLPASRGDLSDWVELMEAVEALCPVWPVRERPLVREYKFKL